jgi:hypothetical protein
MLSINIHLAWRHCRLWFDSTARFAHQPVTRCSIVICMTGSLALKELKILEVRKLLNFYSDTFHYQLLIVENSIYRHSFQFALHFQCPGYLSFMIHSRRIHHLYLLLIHMYVSRLQIYFYVCLTQGHILGFYGRAFSRALDSSSLEVGARSAAR